LLAILSDGSASTFVAPFLTPPPVLNSPAAPGRVATRISSTPSNASTSLAGRSFSAAMTSLSSAAVHLAVPSSLTERNPNVFVSSAIASASLSCAEGGAMPAPTSSAVTFISLSTRKVMRAKVGGFASEKLVGPIVSDSLFGARCCAIAYSEYLRKNSSCVLAFTPTVVTLLK
jgi:hypothetical protein